MPIALSSLTTAAPTPPHAPVRPKRMWQRIDPLGLGALLFAAIGFVAVLLLLRPADGSLAAPPRLEMAQPAAFVDAHHPVDKHDDPARALSVFSPFQFDSHHPVDRHDQP